MAGHPILIVDGRADGTHNRPRHAVSQSNIDV